MKSIYILLTRSETYVSKLIHLTTSDPFTHVSISFDRSLQPLYGFARKTPRRALPAGLRTEPLNEGYYRQHRDIPCAVYEFQVSDDVYWRAKRLVDEAQAQAAAAGARPRQAPGQLSIEGAKAPQPQEAPKAPRRRKNPLRHQEEYEQEGFVSFFEKK